MIKNYHIKLTLLYNYYTNQKIHIDYCYCYYLIYLFNCPIFSFSETLVKLNLSISPLLIL